MAPPYIVGDSSPFLKRVLIPFWVVRILVMLVQIGLYALVVTGLGVFKDDVQKLYDEYNTHLAYETVLAVSCVIMVIILLCLILDLVCIIMRARRTLSPPFFLGVNITQSVFYVVNFVLTMVNAHNGVLSIVIGVIILLSFLGLLIYASIIYHKFRTGTLQGAYAAANNPEVHNLVTNTGYPSAEPTHPQQSYAQDYPKSAYYDQQAAAEAQAYGGQGYAAPAPSPSPGPGQAYEPYTSTTPHRARARSQSPPADQAKPFVQGGSAV